MRRARRILSAAFVALLIATGLPDSSAAAPSHARDKAADVTGLNHACGIATDTEGDLYAASAGESKIKVYDPSHNLLTEIANANEPCALAVQTDGTLYVSEQATGEVVRYEPNAYPFSGIPTYGSREVIDSSGQAKGIAVDPFDNRLYVAEGTRVSAYDSEGKLGTNETQETRCFFCTGGEYKLKFAGEETAPIPFEAEASVVEARLLELGAFDPGDISVVVAEGNKKVHLITFEGKYAHTDVEALIGIPYTITGAGSQEVKISEAVKGFSGQIGEGHLTAATGVAPYTYKFESKQTYHLAVADASEDQVKLFSAPSFKEQKLRRTLNGPAAGEDFGFAPQGAYLAADKGSCPPAAQACAAGHFLLYDHSHEVIDEFEANGELVSQTPFAFPGAEPTALAVERSPAAGNGTLYATSGAGGGAKAIAFDPLPAPSRTGPEAPPLSLTQEKACSVAIDSHGDRYVAVGSEVFVYGPSGGEPLTTVKGGSGSQCRIAVDSEGNVYALLSGAEKTVAYFEPTSFPPEAGTTYAAAVTVAKQSEFEGEKINSLAIDPADDRLFVNNPQQTNEYASAAEGSALLTAKFGSGLGIPTRFSVAAYGATGDVYIATGSGTGRIYVLDPEGKEVLTQITGAGSPSGSFGASAGAIAVDQSNGHVLAFSPGEAVKEYEPSGAFVAQFGASTALVTSDFGVAVDNGAFSPNEGTAYLAFDDTAPETYDLTAFGALGYGPTPPTEEFELKLAKSGAGTGTVVSDPAGIECGSECEAPYPEGTEVTLQASPAEGSEFVSWSGCGSEPEGKCLVEMTATAEVTATFAKEEAPPTHTLTLEVNGPGEVSAPGEDVICPSLYCAETYNDGETITVYASPDEGAHLVEFIGCEAEPVEGECEVTMSEDRTVKAIFEANQQTLTVHVTGNGEVSDGAGLSCTEAGNGSAACEETYLEGTAVSLSASAAGGSIFTGWGGACGGEGSCEVTMDAAKEVTASFEPEGGPAGPPLTLTIEEGSGTVVSDPAGIECHGSPPGEGACTTEEIATGESVTLTASPAPGYLFKSWKKCDPGQVNGRQCTVTMSAAKTVGAKFVKVWSLEASKSGGPGILSTSPGGVNCGYTCQSSTALYKEASLTVKNKPAKHFHFLEYANGTGSASICNGHDAAEGCQFTIAADSSIEEVYAEDAKNTLSLAKEGGGQGSVKTKPTNVNCGYTCTAAEAEFYAAETAVPVTVKLNKGTSSVTWVKGAGTCTGTVETTESTCTVDMSSSHELVAKFE